MANIISLKNGALEADILPFGATLSRLRHNTRDLILGFVDPAQHTVVPIFAGQLVGPIANRLAGGTLKIDGQEHHMERNENGRTTLHSGSTGLHAQTWEISEQTENMARLDCTLADGFGGLPGTRQITVCYRITQDQLSLGITATTTRTTPMNIAHHPYWALDGDIGKTMLWVSADSYLPKDREKIPTGTIQPVTGTPFDFRTPKPIPRDQGIDHCLCLSSHQNTSARHVATLTSQSGLCVDIHTTEPGLQIYDGAGLPTQDDLNSVPHALRPFSGIALEPQGWPDAPNHADFPSILLKSKELYHQSTRYKITQK